MHTKDGQNHLLAIKTIWFTMCNISNLQGGCLFSLKHLFGLQYSGFWKSDLMHVCFSLIRLQGWVLSSCACAGESSSTEWSLWHSAWAWQASLWWGTPTGTFHATSCRISVREDTWRMVFNGVPHQVYLCELMCMDRCIHRYNCSI